MKSVSLLFFIFASVQALKLPDYIEKCSKTDPALSECLTKRANDAWPTLVKGDSKYHVQELDPLYVPFLHIRVDKNLMGNLSEAKLNGLKDTIINKVDLNPQLRKLDVVFTVPRMNFEGTYDVAGRLLFLPLEGNGPCNLTFSDMECHLSVDYEYRTKNNKQYIEIKHNNLKYKTTRAYFRLDNLFGGDETLGREMNKVLDESWEAVNDEIGVRFGEGVGEIFSQVLQSFFRKVSIENVFLP